MSITITIKNSDLPSLMDAYGKVATAHITDADINMAEKIAVSNGTSVAEALSALKDAVQKVTYAAGKNYNRLQSAAKARDTQVQALEDSYDEPANEAYNERRIQLCEQFAERDPQGAPIMRERPDSDQRDYTFSKKNAKLLKAEMTELKLAFKDDLDALATYREEFEAAINAIDANVIEVKIHQAPWGSKPVAISGSYVDLVAPMFTDAPTFD